MSQKSQNIPIIKQDLGTFSRVIFIVIDKPYGKVYRFFRRI